MVERDRRWEGAGIAKRMMLYAQGKLRKPLETRYVSLLFDVTCSYSDENDLDEYWLGVLAKLCLHYETGQLDRSQRKIKRLRAQFEQLMLSRCRFCPLPVLDLPGSRCTNGSLTESLPLPTINAQG